MNNSIDDYYTKEEAAGLVGHPLIKDGKALLAFLRNQQIFIRQEIADSLGNPHLVTVPREEFVEMGFFEVENRSLQRKSFQLETKIIMFKNPGIAFIQGLLYSLK